LTLLCKSIVANWMFLIDTWKEIDGWRKMKWASSTTRWHKRLWTHETIGIEIIWMSKIKHKFIRKMKKILHFALRRLVHLHFRTMNKLVWNELDFYLVCKTMMKLLFFHELWNSSDHCLEHSSSFNFYAFGSFTNHITLCLFGFFWRTLISFLLLFLFSLLMSLIVHLFFRLVLLRLLRLDSLLRLFIFTFTHFVFYWIYDNTPFLFLFYCKIA